MYSTLAVTKENLQIKLKMDGILNGIIYYSNIDMRETDIECLIDVSKGKYKSKATLSSLLASTPDGAIKSLTVGFKRIKLD